MNKRYKKVARQNVVNLENNRRQKNVALAVCLVLAIIGISSFGYNKWRTNDLKAKASTLFITPIYDDGKGTVIKACKKTSPGAPSKAMYIYKKPIGARGIDSTLQGIDRQSVTQWWGDEVNAIEVEVPSTGYTAAGLTKDGVQYVLETVHIKVLPECTW